MSRISAVHAREVLDSRGWPTVEAELALDDGTVAAASVPAGASTGRHEAHELRDRDARRYGGRGVLGAVAGIEREIAPALIGADAREQSAIDELLIELDGTADKSHLGANALLAVSLAVARAGADSRRVPLWRHLVTGRGPVLPLPMVNIVSGGLHARQGLDFQDFLVVPLAATSVSRALEMTVAVRDAAAELLRARKLSTLKADEGGFGPPLGDATAALELLVEAISGAGFDPGNDVAIALDVAATHFHDARQGGYRLSGQDAVLDAVQLVELLESLARRFPIVSIEDPLAEDDWDGWSHATERLAGRLQLLGDDLFTTNPQRLGRGIDDGIANAVLIKMNQIGTLTETLAVVELAQRSGYRCVVSARSGETEDAAMADLAVACGAGQIKVGSVAQSERLAKYNQLLRIEDSLGDRAEYAGAGALAGR
jgi:enolase